MAFGELGGMMPAVGGRGLVPEGPKVGL